MSRLLTQLNETRSECVLRHIERYIRSTKGASWETYSEDVVVAWQDSVPEAVRGCDFKADGPLLKRMETNGRKIRRWRDPNESARPSMDAEDWLLKALPDPHRSECLAEITARHGGLFVPIGCAADGPLRAPAELLTECGQALQALGKLLADGQIAASDSTADLLNARKECLDVSACVQGLVAQIDAALDQQRAVVASGGKP